MPNPSDRPIDYAAIARSTPTASGKPLSFLPAILETCTQEPQAIALLIFPLKALAIDQMSKLEVIRSMDTQLVKSFLQAVNLSAIGIDIEALLGKKS